MAGSVRLGAVRAPFAVLGICALAAVLGGAAAAAGLARHDRTSSCPATASFPDEPRDDTPSWSPDGRSIAFASKRDGTLQIYILSFADCEVRQLTRGPTVAYAPDWSPDGRRLVFERSDGVDSDLWIVGVDGTGLRRLTRARSRTRRESIDLFPDWSRRGLIAFTRDESSETAGTEVRNLYTIRPDGRGLRRLTGGGWHMSPAWSRDGLRLAWECGEAICTMRSDGRDRRRLIPSGEDPSWRPDGRALVVVSRGSLHLLPFGGRVRRVTPFVDDGDTHPDWSPDGRWIVFARSSRQRAIGTALYAVRPNGTSLRQLTARR
jgi:Tol biopolymer transport system component